MRTRVALHTKHPVTACFALAFAISWGGVILAVGPGGFPGTPEQFEILLPVMLFSFLPPYRLLMVWVYGRTGSLLGAMPWGAVAGVEAADRRVVP